MPAVFIKTYGCQMNERDSEQVARQFQERGYTLARSEAEADVILLNTCSVRDMAEQKALGKMNAIRGFKNRKQHVVLGFMGCMAQSRGEELVKLLPEVDLVVGTQKYHRVVDHVEEIRRLRGNPGMDDLRGSIVDIEPESESQNAIRDHLLKEKQVTAFVSIMQGCNMHCTFCIVPSTRGAERSRPLEEIVSETRTLAARGIKEVTLLGQIVNLYGRHEFPKDASGRSPFVQLLYALEEIPGLERVRFTSPHPIGYRKDLVQAFRDLDKLCEHIHLPLQSGSGRILKAMHRAYTPDQYRRLVDDIRAACPEMAITTDIIVGFPGETEEDYLETRRLVEEVGFDNAFIFRYSERKDTPAASMASKVPDEEKMRRNQDLLGVIDGIALKKAEALIGQTVQILVEGPSKTRADRASGRTRGNKIVVFDGGSRHYGELLEVRITESSNFTFYAEPDILP